MAEIFKNSINRWILMMFSIWTLTITASYYWNHQQVSSLVMEQASSELRTNFFKDLTFRQWATNHGGVYVPVTEEIQPDPYIAFLPERNVITPSGRLLTLINPALMVRQFNELSNKTNKVQGHISSLHPLNPINMPDEWEAEALKSFNLGNTEVEAVSNINGEPYLRLIRVMKMTKKCLFCHLHQGYKVDDVAGGVSMSMPLSELEQTADRKVSLIGIGHVILWLLGIAAIWLGGRRVFQGIDESNRAYLALSETKAQTISILNTSLDAIVTINTEDLVTDWNQQAEHIFGWSKDEAIGKGLTGLIIPERYRKRHLQGIQTFIDSGEAPVFSKRMVATALKKDSKEFPVELTVSPLYAGEKVAFSAFIRDISEQKRTEEKINKDYHSQRVIASVLEISTRSITFKEKLEQSLDEILSTPWLSLQGKGLIFLIDKKTDTLILKAQRGVSDFILKECAKVKFGKCLCGKTAQDQQVIFTSCLDEMHTVSHPTMEEHGHYCLPIESDDQLKGVLNLYLNHGHEVNDQEINYLEVIANTLGNIIKQHENEEQLQYFAYYDKLTSLPNRTLFINRIDQCIKHSKRNEHYQYAVLFLDLDKFKKINDSLGHSVGDQVLDHVAKSLTSCIRDIDTVARLGGDEFAILLEDIDDISDAYRTASRIHQQLVNPVQLERHQVYTSTSIGIAQGLKSYSDHNELLRDADIAMYRAKQKGSGYTEVFDERMHTRAVKVLDIENELRQAVERQEFSLNLQPIISIKEKRIIGFESLIRWNNPKRGFVPPDEFIPIAEETGLINEIGLWVLEESCRQMKYWNDTFPGQESLYISVNVSPVQFLRKDLISEIDSRLKSLSFDTANLRLEITESILMENPDTAARMLEDLKSRNIRLYLDDFGTGYSSLSYLHNFPFDTLKIDRSFVAKLATGEEHIGMVKTIIAVAKSFAMDVIAEGVETKEELSILEELGCHNIQGYYFSKPLSVTDAEQFLKDFNES